MTVFVCSSTSEQVVMSLMFDVMSPAHFCVPLSPCAVKFHEYT